MKGGFRKLIFFVLLVGVTYLAYKYMIKPANRHLTEQRARVQKKLNKLEEFEKATVAAVDLAKQMEEITEAINFFESRLPPKSEIHKVLENLTIIAQRQGLHPKTIRPLQIKENCGYIEQPMKMQLVGNYESFYSFILEMEKLPRIIKVRELKLDRLKSVESKVTANFIVSVFFQHESNSAS